MSAPFESGKHWLSVHGLLQLDHPLTFDGSVLRMRPGSRAYDVPITVVVIVDNVGNYLNTLSSLANLDYKNYTVIFTCLSKQIYDSLSGHLMAYKHVIPISGVFKPTKTLTPAEAALAGAQCAKSSHVCIMYNGDVLHPAAFARAAAAVKETDLEYYSSESMTVSSSGWVTPAVVTLPDDRLMLFKTHVMAYLKTLLGATIHPRAPFWDLAHRLAKQSYRLPDLLHFHGGTDDDQAAVDLYTAFCDCDEAKGADDGTATTQPPERIG
jgi:hypothetical protein